MNLTPEDLALFAAIGVDPSLVDRAGVRRVTHGEAMFTCGIRYRSEHLEGLAFPYYDPTTAAVLSWRVRRDHPERERDGTPIAKYLAPPDRRHLYFGPAPVQTLADRAISIVVVESEKAVLALRAASQTTGKTLLPIGLGGCWGFRGNVGKTTAADGTRVDEKGVLPDFDRLAWSDRDVVIVFDANAATNGSVQAAQSQLAAELARAGRWSACCRYRSSPA